MRNTKQQNLIYLFLFLVFPFLTTNLLAQDILLRVKKGTVTHNNSKLTLSSPQFQLKSGDKVIVPAEAVLVGTVGGSFVQVPSGKSYTYDDVKKLAKSATIKASVGNEVFRGTLQKTSNNYASSTRSGENDPDFYSPSDAPDVLTILDEKFRLEIGNNKTKLLSNIRLINTDNAEVTYDEKPNNLLVELTNLPEGNYKWTYQIEFDRDDSKVETSFENSFIIPSEKIKAAMLKDYNNYKNQLLENKKKKLISDDFYQILLEEYKAEKKIYTKE